MAHASSDRPAVGPADDPVVGRGAQLAALGDFVSAAGRGGQALLVLGEAGMGKSLLLDLAAGRATGAGLQVVRARGSETETDLAFAGLHQLLRHGLDDADVLPPRQRSALFSAFGREEAEPPDRLLLGLATLTLLSELAGRAPLLAVVDDVQWFDTASAEALGFLTRRLEGEAISVLLSARGHTVPAHLDHDLPVLPLPPLDHSDAARLLDPQPGVRDGPVRHQILEQAAGVPLALVELAKVVARPGALPVAGDPLPPTDRLERVFATHVAELPAATRELLLLAAAAGSAELGTLLAGVPDGHDLAVWRPAEEAGLVTFDQGEPRFRHPLARSGVYHAAPPADRNRAHRRLAGLLHDDPDRRAWHLAAASLHPDEEVAAALEATADRARQRGGWAAAATALERAARLSPDPKDQARRLVHAASMAMFTGYTRWVEQLAARAVALTDDPQIRLRASLYAGWAATSSTRHGAALDLLLPVVEATARDAPDVALGALAPATVAAYYSGEDALRDRVAAAVRLIPSQHDESALVWARAGIDPCGNRGWAVETLTRAASAPSLSIQQLNALGAAAWVLDETPLAVHLLTDLLDRFGHIATEGSNAVITSILAWAQYDGGRWSAAQLTQADAARIAARTTMDVVIAGAATVDATLAALQGRTDVARAAAAEALAAVDPRQTRAVAVRARWAAGAAAAADGDFEAAYELLRLLFDPDGRPVHHHASVFGVGELAAAAARVGRVGEARTVVDGLRSRLAGGASPRIEQLLARATALLATPGNAEPHFRAALAVPAGDRWPFERAQTRLDYAEWLRRRRRIGEARAQLTQATEVFERLGARPWADRAYAELRAAGVAVVRTDPSAFRTLTAQEQHIVRLAAHGMTNRDIGERLFLSPRTVGSHLYRVFPKLGVTARTQLRDVVDDAT